VRLPYRSIDTRQRTAREWLLKQDDLDDWPPQESFNLTTRIKHRFDTPRIPSQTPEEEGVKEAVGDETVQADREDEGDEEDEYDDPNAREDNDVEELNALNTEVMEEDDLNGGTDE
jgi:hypothetical protein